MSNANVGIEKQPDSNSQRMSSQMQAVVRLLAGQEERTIAQKLADSNRPTWEQYKKDNHEHLNLDGAEQREMEKYRQQLDSEREKLLSRGRNHSKKAKKRRRDDSSDDSSRSRDRDRKHKKKRKRKRKHRRHDDSSSDSSDSGESSEEERRRKHRRKHKKRKKDKKRKSSRKRDDDSGSESDGSHYRLSKFFDEGE